MCVIVRKPKGVKVPIETLRQCWQANKDGAGFMYAENGTLVFQKGLMSFKAFLRAYQKIAPTDKEVLIHFRYATHGAVANAQTHPFIVHESIGVMHNGIINLEDEKVGYIPPDEEDDEQYQCRKCKTVQEIDEFPAKCVKCKTTLYYSNVDEIIVDKPDLSDEEIEEALNDRQEAGVGISDEGDGILLNDDKLLDKHSDKSKRRWNEDTDVVTRYDTAHYLKSDKPIEVESDTQKFCSQIMEKLPKGFLNDEAICMLLSQFLIHNYSVIACLNEKGEVKMLGDMSSQYDEKGVWFSNSFWKRSNIVTTTSFFKASESSKSKLCSGYGEFSDWDDYQEKRTKSWYRREFGGI